jgi:two-component system NarL family sensor kinase
MSDSPQAIWWVFVFGALASLILLVAVVGSLIVSQRRLMKLHRSHARRVLEAQEEERAWVSREVHDDALQRLALIGRECGDASRAMAGRAPEQSHRLNAIQGEVDDLGIFLRGLAHRLHPALIDRGGLYAALSGLGEELQRGYAVQLTVQLPPAEALLSINPQRALVLYRIAQEALHNVVKHAGVAAAELRLSASGNGLELSVSDHGRGFDSSKATKSDGIGLIGMRERAYLAEGKVEITSRPGEGTLVRAWFPATQRDGA